MASLDPRSRELRKAIIDVLACSQRGHLGSALSILEILRTLYDHILTYDSLNPDWPMRDRFILSKGHGCLALYVLLAEKGFFPKKELRRFCALDGMLGGHPEYRKIPGVEASTGALGHGLSIAIGIALNGRYERAPYRTIVLLGDGECNEGSIWEAAMCASKHCLDSLMVIVDYNKQQSYGYTSEVLELEPFVDKWRSFGFEVKEANGHDVEELTRILNGIPFQRHKPGVLICHTIKGKGIPFVERNLAWHHKSRVSSSEIADLYSALSDNPCEKPA